MAEIVGKKMSQYTSVDTLTPEKKSAFLGSAEVTVFGTDPEDANAKANYSVPLSEITPSPAVPTKLSDLTDDITTSEYSASGTAPVDGTAVAAALGGLATVASTGNYSDLNGVPTIPTASGLAGDGLEEASGKLKVVTKVPSPGTNVHRGHVLKVDNSDAVVWDAPASPTVTVDNATIKNGNDGLYVNSGRGLQLGSGALMCKLKENGGLEFNENDDSIQVVADTGLALTGTGGIGINFTGANNNEVLTCSKTVDGDDVTYAAVWKPGIPPVGTNQHRGDVLTVDDSDQVVWDAAPGSVEISQYNGDLSAVSATNDASSGGYVFDVNLDSNTLEKRSTTGAGQISYIAVKNPVPTPAAADQGKVLSVLDAAGGIGWATPQGGDMPIIYTINTDGKPASDYYHWIFPDAESVYNDCVSGKTVMLRVFDRQAERYTYFVLDNVHSSSYDPQCLFCSSQTNLFIKVGYHSEDHKWYFSIANDWLYGQVNYLTQNYLLYASLSSGSVQGIDPYAVYNYLANTGNGNPVPRTVTISLFDGSKFIYLQPDSYSHGQINFASLGGDTMVMTEDPSEGTWSITYTPHT